jgi:hypothetical protein
MAASKTPSFWIGTTVKPIHMTASSMQDVSLHDPKLCISIVLARLAQGAPAAALTMLAFLSPRLALPVATDFISKDHFPGIIRTASWRSSHPNLRR